MKYSFGKRSTQIKDTISLNLELVFDEALETDLIDIVLIEGRRDRARQDKFFYGVPQRSKLPWPKSKHNVLNPEDFAHAVDAAPYVNGKASDNFYHCCFLAGVILAIGARLHIPIRWGGNWDKDGEPITDQTFQDLWHYEEII